MSDEVSTLKARIAELEQLAEERAYEVQGRGIDLQRLQARCDMRRRQLRKARAERDLAISQRDDAAKVAQRAEDEAATLRLTLTGTIHWREMELLMRLYADPADLVECLQLTLRSRKHAEHREAGVPEGGLQAELTPEGKFITVRVPAVEV